MTTLFTKLPQTLKLLNDIAKLAKLIDESKNPFEDLMKILGEKNVIDPKNRNGTQTQTNT